MTTERGLESACEFLVGEVRQAWPWHWKQGARRPPLRSGTDSSIVRLLTDFRIKGVSESAARGIAAWSSGLAVEVFERVPGPGEVLRLQARGKRCVSLLPAGVSSAPHAGAVEFLLHDLCHVGKFSDPSYYREQVGFFATFARALDTLDWRMLESELDEEWISDRDRVLSDMNGSSIFLFAAFKMKLKMAARRAVARENGREPVQRGPLSLDEERGYRGLLGRALTLLGLNAADLHAAAVVTSARRDCPRAAALLSEYFRGAGAFVLESATGVMHRGAASAAEIRLPAR